MKRKIRIAGTHWSKGKLYYYSPTWNAVLVCRPWEPYPAGWLLRLNASAPVWRHCRPVLRCGTFRVGIPSEERRFDQALSTTGRNLPATRPPARFYAQDVRKQAALLAFFEQIPLKARRIARKVPRQFHMIALLRAAGSPAYDLCRSGAAGMTLAYGLASLPAFRKSAKPLRDAKALLNKGVKRRRIAEYLGFPKSLSESVVRLMGKIPERALTLGTLFRLREAAELAEKHRAARKLLLHMNEVTEPALELLRPEYINWITPNLVEEVSRKEKRYPRTARSHLRDLLEMILAVEGGTGCPNRYGFGSIAAVREAHDEYARRVYRSRATEPLKSIVLPAPPFPEIEHTARDGKMSVRLEPQTTADALCEFGSPRRMSNCVGPGYVRRIAEARGNAYIYSVKLRPGAAAGEEELCLFVRRRGLSGPFYIAELKGRFNRFPSPEEEDAVKEALAAAQGRGEGRQ